MAFDESDNQTNTITEAQDRALQERFQEELFYETYVRPVVASTSESDAAAGLPNLELIDRVAAEARRDAWFFENTFVRPGEQSLPNQAGAGSVTETGNGDRSMRADQAAYALRGTESGEQSVIRQVATNVISNPQNLSETFQHQVNMAVAQGGPNAAESLVKALNAEMRNRGIAGNAVFSQKQGDVLLTFGKHSHRAAVAR